MTKTIRHAAAIAAIAMLGAPAGGLAAAPAKSHHYPAKLTKAFISTCTRTAKASAGKRLTKAQAKTYCSAALKCIEAKLTLKQFETVVKNMQTGAKNPKVKVLVSCEKAALKKIGH